MSGVIDTHCHILPMCDDGPAHWGKSMEMAQEAVLQGIRHIVATPHHGKNGYDNRQGKVRSLTGQFNRILKHADVPLTVWPGQEFHLADGAGVTLPPETLQPIGDGKYVLVELPSLRTPGNLTAFVRVLRLQGLSPVIVHPERHVPFIREPAAVWRWLDEGVLFQLTAPSLFGQYGPEAQEAAWKFANNGWIHLLASDAHDTAKRTFQLQEAYRLLETAGSAGLSARLRANAERALHGKPIDTGRPARPEPQPAARRTNVWWRRGNG